MCGPALAMAGASVGMQLLGNRAEDKAIGQQIAAQNAMKQQKVRELNYNLASLSREQVDQFDQAVTQLQGQSINSLRNQGMLYAALGETNLEGRSMDAVMREVEGQDARVSDSIRDSYGKSWQGLQYAKETNILETQSSLDGMPKIKTPSAFGRTLGVIGAGLDGFGMGGDVAKGIGSVLSSAGGGSSGGITAGIKGITGMVTGLFGGGGTGANTGLNAAGGLRVQKF